MIDRVAERLDPAAFSKPHLLLGSEAPPRGATRGRVALSVLAALLLLPYLWVPVYNFPDPRPFSGPRLYNPYEAIAEPWRRVNLHAHARAWMGITNGRQSEA